MRKILLASAGMLVCFLLAATSCNKPENHIIPEPTPTPTPDPQPDPDKKGTLCVDCGQTPMIVAYYTEYSKEIPDATLLTHINFAHGRFINTATGKGGIVIGPPNTPKDDSSYIDKLKKVVKLKETNPKLKVLLMIGGWGMNADGFSMMARDASNRTDFCKSVKSKIDEYGLDGVDIDWEYPTKSAEGTAYHVDDKENFVLVLKELRETLGTSKIISFASSSSCKYMNWPDAIKYIDYVNVMTYDMGCAPNGHNSPLYSSSTFPDSSGASDSIRKHVQAGIPIGRLNLGIPFYGKAEKNPVNKVYEYEVKYNEMYDILNNNKYNGKDVTGKNIRKFDKTALVPYLTDTDGHILLVYEDPESVAYKGEYVVTKKMGGAMCWEYRHDDSNHSLLKALVKAVYGKESVL